MLVPLLMSDYLVALPLTIACDQRRIPVKTMASMTHKIIFHSDNFDVVLAIILSPYSMF